MYPPREFKTKKEIEMWYRELAKVEKLQWKAFYEDAREDKDEIEAGSEALNFVHRLRAVKAVASRWKGGHPPYNTRYLRMPGGGIKDTEDPHTRQWLTRQAQLHGR